MGFMLRFFGLCGAIAALCSLAWGQEAYAVKGVAGTSLWVAGKVIPSLGTSTVKRLSWSQGGKTLAMLTSDGVLQTISPDDGATREIAKNASGIRWSTASQQLAYESEGSIWIVDTANPSDKPVKVVTDGAAVAWSPDGARIAYSSKGAIWIALANGTAARRVLTGRSAISMDWSTDGRQLAFLERGLSSKPGGVFVAGVNRQGLRKIGEAKGGRVAFSPDGRRLLVEQLPSSRIYEIEKASYVTLAPEGKDWEWTGPRHVAALVGLSPVEAQWPDTTMSPLEKAKGLPTGDVERWAQAPTVLISNELLSKGPFEGAARPMPENLRIQGFVESVDPLNGKFSLRVSSVVNSKGWETNLAQSLSQKLTVPDGARQNDGTGRYKPLRVMNIRPDLEVSAIVRADALDGGKELDVSEVWIAAEKQEIGALSNIAPRLQGLPLAHDGVSPEKPIVPLVYPVAGKTFLQDWFLARRGGGSRRHQGQDLMAAKMTPLVACFDGVIYLGHGEKNGHYTMTIRGDNGWTANYYHVNNDTPGTDDGWRSVRICSWFREWAAGHSWAVHRLRRRQRQRGDHRSSSALRVMGSGDRWSDQRLSFSHGRQQDRTAYRFGSQSRNEAS
jgi:murein DD-endopeptidase MepM/ murein hydrolase activator NlpD